MRVFVRSKVALLLIVIMGLSGCMATFPKPWLAYTNSTHAMADTAIVVCPDEEDFSCGIVEVDGMELYKGDWSFKGIPPWVRVLPGRHQIKITSRGRGLTGYGNITFQAQGQHVYRIGMDVNAHWWGGWFRPTVTDLGEKTSYEFRDGAGGKLIGIAGFN